MADLSNLELKVYISGAQLSNVKLGNEAKVLIDSDAKEMQTMSGKITWISVGIGIHTQNYSDQRGTGKINVPRLKFWSLTMAG